jgi:hypothetical protein
MRCDSEGGGSQRSISVEPELNRFYDMVYYFIAPVCKWQDYLQ